MIHLCGKHYVDRVEDVTKVTVYSNQPSVELFANGVSLGVKEAPDHFFYFEVPNVGTTHLVAKAGELTDESVINKVSEPNPAYTLVEKGAVLNWWDIIEVPGYCSLNTKLKQVLAGAGDEKAVALLEPLVSYGGDAKTLHMLDTMTVLRAVNLITGAMGLKVTKEQLMDLNAELNKIAIQ